jgi:hypothetical protein
MEFKLRYKKEEIYIGSKDHVWHQGMVGIEARSDLCRNKEWRAFKCLPLFFT